MKPTLRTRKPAGDLNAEDFVAFQLWKYVMDESKYDETYVKPLALKSIPSGDLYHVAASFTVAFGQSFQGTTEVLTMKTTPEYRFPMVFAGKDMFDLKPPGGPVICMPDVAAKVAAKFEKEYENYLKAVEKVFGRPAAEVFPIKWVALVPFEGTTDYPCGEIPYPPATGYQFQIFEIPDWIKQIKADAEELDRIEKEKRRKKNKDK